MPCLFRDIHPAAVGLGFDDGLPAHVDALGQVGTDHRDAGGTRAAAPAAGGLGAILRFVAGGDTSAGIAEQAAFDIDDRAVLDPDLHIGGMSEAQAPPGIVFVLGAGERVHGLAAADQQQAEEGKEATHHQLP
ncbi:hypothetical protein D9M71_626710 [compost metagenome]